MAEFDNYLSCEQYSAAPDSDKSPGFKTWFEESNSSWYFAAVTNRGRVVLRSEAYTTENARDNGIDSVNRNRDIEARYSVVQDTGKWYVILKAGNHQEIARSCAHNSEAAARADIAMCASNAIEAATTITDDYLPCATYSGHAITEKHPGFATFSHEGQHYFAMVDGAGNVILRSEGYTSASARDNGMLSVNRNRDEKERFSIIQDDNDSQLYIILTSANHQEIARSCPFENVAAAQTSLDQILAPHSAAIVEDYLACEAYANQTAAEKHPGFTVFTQEGQHYFAMVDGRGGIILRSEAYTTSSARDNGIESVLRNRDIEERYTIVKNDNDGLWYTCLKSGNHQEIARSCGFADQAAAEGHLLHCYSKAALENIATGAGQIVEDYLPCDAYLHGSTSNFDGFTIFQDNKTKLHYFAMIDDNGKVALKSEGYKDPKRRDNGIESVLRNRGIKDHWKEFEGEHGFYMSLRAVNHQEIARSCHYKSHAAMAAWFLPFLAAHANWGKDAEPEAVVAPAALGAEGTAAAAGATMTTHTNAPIPVEGGNNWWKWLLGLLLLAGLLWLLLRGCDGCTNKPTAPVVPAPISTAPIDTMKKEMAPAPAPEPEPVTASCNCAAQTDPVFRPNTGTPRSLTRLGTNPEFGNAHGLSPAEFYAKLQKQHKNNAVDRSFLDRVFKAMGYKNGFADAKAEQFSAVEIPAGTVGNMGYSTAHKTGYDRLDATGKDLLAFRIKAANGCDLHFMKTCGNHFFFCPK